LVNGVQVDPVEDMEFAYDQNNITIDLIGISYKEEKSVRYQYRLAESDTGWRHLTDHHSIVFAALAPGAYTFFARAINRSGIPSIEPVSLSFTIAPPLWLRLWFIATVILIVLAVVFAFIRTRVQRLLEIERIRSRIASDLHDDIGAGLTRIAILSSVIERELPKKNKEGGGGAQMIESLKKIGDTARELVDAMSDVVWSLDVKNESLERLIPRLRSFAFEACEAKDIALTFSVDEKISSLHFSSENVRNILLCAKEAITNIVRHSECNEAIIEFSLQENGISLRIEDNGKGYDIMGKKDGHGLKNMQKRAERTGGTFSITTARKKGTRIRASFLARE
jgi:signal transduction histidine kinase